MRPEAAAHRRHRGAVPNLRRGDRQKIAELVNDRRIDGIRDVRNESAGDTTRLVVELKRTPMRRWCSTTLQAHPDANVVPAMCSRSSTACRAAEFAAGAHVYVEHQVEVVTRRSEHRLGKARDRPTSSRVSSRRSTRSTDHHLIRGSESADAAKRALMAAPSSSATCKPRFVLYMPCAAGALERQRVRDEFDELQTTIAELESILADNRSCAA